MTEILRAGPETRITLHFAVRLMDGTELDSTFGGDPAAFVWGDESLLPGFESALRGLKAGDRRSVFLEAKKAFGDYNDENVQHFTRDTFAQYDTLEPGMVLSFADAAGGELGPRHRRRERQHPRPADTLQHPPGVGEDTRSAFAGGPDTVV